LPEEEGDTGRNALVAEHAQPIRMRRARPGADLAAGDHPVERLPCRSVDGDRSSAAVDRVVTASEVIKIAVANRHCFGHDPVEQGFEANPARCSGRFEPIVEARDPILIFDRNAKPEVRQGSRFEPKRPIFRRGCARSSVFDPAKNPVIQCSGVPTARARPALLELGSRAGAAVVVAGLAQGPWVDKISNDNLLAFSAMRRGVSGSP